MKAKGHLEAFNHFNFAVRDADVFRDSWEKAFGFHIPEIMDKSAFADIQKKGPMFMNPPTYRGGLMPAGIAPSSCPPIYQPNKRMIEAKATGCMPTVTKAYERSGNCIQYFGIVEGENRNPFLQSLKQDYGCEVLEEMFYTPMPGDFCFVETESVLGFDLCVKADGALNGRVEVILQDTAECTIVTDDLEKSVRNYTDIFDIKEPEIRTVSEKIRVGTTEREAEFRVARINEAPFTLYLAEDKNNGPFSDYAKRYTFGIHHISFDMGDKCEEFAAHLKSALDISILAEYDLDDQHYYLFDSKEKMGAYLAVRKRREQLPQ